MPQRGKMARKLFSAIRLCDSSSFYRAVQVNGDFGSMCIATCLTHGKNIVPSYDGTLPQGRSSFARLLFEIQHQSFHSLQPPNLRSIAYTGLGLKCKRQLSQFRRSSPGARITVLQALAILGVERSTKCKTDPGYRFQ